MLKAHQEAELLKAQAEAQAKAAEAEAEALGLGQVEAEPKPAEPVAVEVEIKEKEVPLPDIAEPIVAKPSEGKNMITADNLGKAEMEGLGLAQAEARSTSEAPWLAGG